MTITYPGAGSSEVMAAIWAAAIALACIGLFMYTLSMLVDCQERRFPDPAIRRRWTMVILFIPIIGAFIYRKYGTPQGEKPPPAFPRYY